MRTTHAHHESGSGRARPSGPWRRLAAVAAAAALTAGLAVSLAATPAAANGASTRYVAATGSDTGDCTTQLAPCLTIQYAIGQASDGDTVSVAAGAYNLSAPITVDKAITLQGATQSDVPVITPAAGTAAITVSAQGATIAWLSITGVQGGPVTFGFGVVVKRAASGTTISHIAISGPQSGSGQSQSFGVYLENGPADVTISNNFITGLSEPKTVMGVFIGDSKATTASDNVTISDNTISNIASTNKGAYGIELNNAAGAGQLTISNNDIAFITSANGWVHAIGIEAPAPYLSIRDNRISRLSGSATDTVAVWFENEDTATDIPAVTGNSFTSLDSNAKAIAVDAKMPGTFPGVDATLNYWGSSPVFTSLISTTPQSPVRYVPWYTNSEKTTTATSIPADQKRPTIPVTAGTPTTAVDANVDYSKLRQGNETSVTVPPTTIESTTGMGTAKVDIAGNTTITPQVGAIAWDGVVSAPAVVSPPPGSLPANSTASLAIEVGSSTVSLTFDTPVRLLLPGQAGKHVGFISNNIFTPITTRCGADASNDTVVSGLAAGQACLINSGSDLAVWTTHFTTFVTYTMPSGGGSTPPTAGQTDRIAGADRYATAALIADRFGTANAIVIANGTDAKQGVDALSANDLAGKVGAPILLTQAGSVPAGTLAAVRAVLAGASDPTIYVMGGADSVSDAVVATIKAAAQSVASGTVSVKRIAGADRYATSALAAAAAGTAGTVRFADGGALRSTAILASGQVNADALAAGPVSNAWGLPVLLTTSDQLPPAVAKAITAGKITQLLVLGDPGRISQTVLDQAAAAGVRSVQRVAGSDRFATAAKLYTFAFDTMTDSSGNHYGATKDGTAYLANGLTGFPDALTVGPLAGSTGGALLTARPGELSPAAGTFLSGHQAAFTTVTALGQPATLSTAVLQAAANLL